MTSIDKSNKKGYTGLWNVSYVGKLRYWKQSFEKHIGSFTVNLLKFNQSQAPHKGRKVRDMFSNRFNPSGRSIGAFCLLVLIAIGLAACGGGGGSSTPSDPPVTASGSLSGTSGCTVPENGTSCNPTLAWTTKNATGVKVVLGTTTVATTASGTNTTQVVGVGSSTVTLYDGATKLAEASVDITCAPGTALTSGTCTIAVARYSEFKLVRLADQGGFIGMIMPDGSVTPLKNNSEFTVATTGALAPLAICAIWDTKLVNGWPVVSCQTPGNGGNLRRNFPVDPINGSVEKEYTGVIPAGASMRESGYGTFGDTPYAAYGVTRKGTYLNANEGVYFFTGTDSVNLRLTSDGFVTNKVVATCSAIDCFHYLAVFSN